MSENPKTILDRSSGKVYFQPIPRCPTHGQMHHCHFPSGWTCAGWDGEGCDYKAPEQAWEYLGDSPTG